MQRCHLTAISPERLVEVAPHVTPEVSRIVHRIAMRIVVEVGEDVQSVIQVLRNPPGLGGKGPVGMR